MRYRRHSRAAAAVALALTLGLLLAGCAVLDGGGERVDDGPITRLRELADLLSGSIGTLPVATVTTTPTPLPTPTPDASGVTPSALAAPEGTVATIGNTGGTGVSIRGSCQQGDRTGGTLAEGIEVAVLSLGVGDCEGWSEIASGDVVSWIDNQYLTGLPGLVVGETAPPQEADVRTWVEALADGAGRIASVSRGPGISMSLPLSANFLDHVREDAEELQAAIDAAPQAIPACEEAREPASAAAATLAALASEVATIFREWPDRPVTAETDALANRYIQQQAAAVDALERCATAEPVADAATGEGTE